MSTKNEPAEQQPATSASPNQMIEQINIAWAKRVRESSAWVIEGAPVVGD